MIRRKISLSEAAAYAAQTLPKGILLTTRSGDKVNTMVIGWGTVGMNWNRPVFAAYVRVGRYTRELLDQNPEFTVNIPLAEPDRNAIAVCGAKSGRDMEKLAACRLHTEPGESVSVPAIREFPVTLECKVLYAQKQVLTDIPEPIRNACYPQDVDGTFPMANRDAHIAYIGKITDAYIIRGE